MRDTGESSLAEGLPSDKRSDVFSVFLLKNVDLALLDDVVRVRRIACVDDLVALGEFLERHHPSDFVLLVLVELVEKLDFVKVLAVFFELLHGELLDHFFEGHAVDAPELALADGLD